MAPPAHSGAGPQPPRRARPGWLVDAAMALIISVPAALLLGLLAAGVGQFIAPGRPGLLAAARLLPYLYAVNAGSLFFVLSARRRAHPPPTSWTNETEPRRPA